MATKTQNSFFAFIYCIVLTKTCVADSKFIHAQEIEEKGGFTSNSDVHHILRRNAPGEDANCQKQEQNFLTELTTKKIDKLFTFENESKFAMALAWAGENDGNLIIVTTDSGPLGITTESTVYIGTDFGANVRDVTKEKNIDKTIKKHKGLQRNPHEPKKVYLVGAGTWLYTTENGGVDFVLHDLDFAIDGDIEFHPDKEYQDYLLARSADKTLFVSFDNGKNWKNIHNNVEIVSWGIKSATIGEGDTDKTIYIAAGAHTVDPFLESFFKIATSYTLKKSKDGGNSWTVIHEDVVSFERHGKFLYVSILQNAKEVSSSRLLKFSLDGGSTWREPRIPTIESDQFYRVMDVEDNLVFLHVDFTGDTGFGTLYTSAGEGVIFSESLPRHLYPNFGTTHDFYKVKSMRGVYITSQMNTDNSIHSMITYNRGAEWQKIPRPPGVTCKDESKECYLQIHGMYSVQRDINALPPVSEESAVGIILAHGHVADTLQKTEPDVFVSSDGGYTWNLALKGPHFYQIGDHGGLLVAVSKQEVNPKVIKFSMDEGRCWHEYTFTNKTLNITGLLTEPDSKSSIFMIWGYVHETRKWEVHVIDFKKVLKTKCTDSDYEQWMEHAVQGTGSPGCLLGKKRTFLRLKKDSWCFNGFEHEKTMQSEICQCTIDDFECDYGYFRPGGSQKCVKIPEFQGKYIELCLRGHEEKEISEGYRKIPGDVCSGGFSPTSRKIVLGEKCNEESRADVQFDEHKQESATIGISKGAKVLAVIIVGIILAIAAVMGVYFIRKFMLLRRHKTEYRFSLLNEGDDAPRPDSAGDWDHEIDNAIATSTVRYQDSEDEELSTKVLPPSKRPAHSQNGNVPQRDTNPFTSYHDDSDDDLLS